MDAGPGLWCGGREAIARRHGTLIDVTNVLRRRRLDGAKCKQTASRLQTPQASAGLENGVQTEARESPE